LPPTQLHSFPTRRSSDLIQFERVLTEIADALFVVHHQHNWLLTFRHVSPLKMGHILWAKTHLRYRTTPAKSTRARTRGGEDTKPDRKSTRLNSSHLVISY